MRGLADADKERGGRLCSSIVDDERRGMRRQPPHARRVTGGAGPSAALPLLGDAMASPASERLAADPAAPVTRPLLFLGRAPRSVSEK